MKTVMFISTLLLSLNSMAAPLFEAGTVLEGQIFKGSEAQGQNCVVKIKKITDNNVLGIDCFIYTVESSLLSQSVDLKPFIVNSDAQGMHCAGKDDPRFDLAPYIKGALSSKEDVILGKTDGSWYLSDVKLKLFGKTVMSCKNLTQSK